MGGASAAILVLLNPPNDCQRCCGGFWVPSATGQALGHVRFQLCSMQLFPPRIPRPAMAKKKKKAEFLLANDRALPSPADAELEKFTRKRCRKKRRGRVSPPGRVNNLSSGKASVICKYPTFGNKKNLPPWALAARFFNSDVLLNP